MRFRVKQFDQGDIPKNLYIILEGSLYVTEFTDDGKSVAHEYDIKRRLFWRNCHN